MMEVKVADRCFFAKNCMYQRFIVFLPRKQKGTICVNSKYDFGRYDTFSLERSYS